MHGMDSTNRTVQQPKYYRYTISQLLELSTRINSPFDLSRLSFNAVRAGIVPALCDRTMASRESAVQQGARGWSQQTTDTSEEFVLSQAHRAERPLRQPVNAPPEAHTQMGEGFAHFLKTHSSPNHHRVTAGGRIVPMEKRPGPPCFALPAANDNSKRGSAQKRTLESDAKIAISGYDATSGSSSMQSAAPPGFVPQENVSLAIQKQALESNILMQSQILSYGRALSNGAIYPVMPDMTNQVPILSQQYPVNVSYLPYGSQLPPSNMMSSGSSIAWDSELQGLPGLQAKLTEANQLFGMYDRQLKDLDKYRATHPREDERVRQRVSIVAQRAEVKEDIRRLQAAIGLRESVARWPLPLPQQWPLVDSQGHLLQQYQAHRQPVAIKEPTVLEDTTPKAKLAKSSKLNVAAPAYIPRASISLDNMDVSPIAVTNVSAQPFLPNLPAAQYSRLDTDSLELQAVDAWGERVGAPPEHLLQEQHLLAQAILSKLNSPTTSGDDASDNISAQSIHSAGKASSHMAFGGANSVLDRTGRAPASVEADYEKQMNALRKPSGAITQVTLSDGNVQVVHGRELKPPAVENMNDFERSYWLRKAAYSDQSSHSNKENSRASSFTARPSTSSFENSVLSQDQAKPYGCNLRDSPSRHILSELSASLSYNPSLSTKRSQQAEWDAATHKLRQAAAKQVNVPTDNRENNLALRITEEVQDHFGQEALANKTYSSTSVQNIHVTSSLPRSLDGAVEANLRKINSPGKGCNKIRRSTSPRTIFRSAGDSWFGPFRRTVFDPETKDQEDGVARYGRVR